MLLATKFGAVLWKLKSVDENHTIFTVYCGIVSVCVFSRDFVYLGMATDSIATEQHT